MKIIRYLLVLIIIFVITIFFTFNPIVKYLLTNYATKTFKTPVIISDVQSSFNDKSINVNFIKVQNPPNFKFKNALEINHFNFNLSSATTRNLIVIENLNFDGIKAIMEQNNYNINLKILSDNLKNDNSTNKDKTTNNDIATNKRKIIIQNFALMNSQIIIDTQLLKEKISLPDFNLKNIGGKEGIAISNIGKHLMLILLDRLQDVVKQKGLNIVEDKLKKTLTRKISEKLGLKADSIDKLKNSTNEKINDIKDKVKDKVKNLFKF